MAELRALEGLQALHKELLAVSLHRFDDLQTLEQLLEEHTEAFKKFLDKPPRNSANRTTVTNGKIKIKDDEYAINQDFINDTFKVADELDLDELEAARILLDADAEGDMDTWSRSLWEVGIIRFHQERKYLLACMRLCIAIMDDDDVDDGIREAFSAIVHDRIYGAPIPGSQAKPSVGKIVPRCVTAMQNVKATLQGISEKMAAQTMLQPNVDPSRPQEDQQEKFTFARSSLIEQHQELALILTSAVEKRLAEARDFQDLIQNLKRIDKYDHLLGELPLQNHVVVGVSMGGFC